VARGRRWCVIFADHQFLQVTVAPADASELSKVVACTVKSLEAAEFADSLAPIEQLIDAELLRIAAGGSAPEIIGPRRLLTINTR
jgi:hypothetical protein